MMLRRVQSSGRVLVGGDHVTNRVDCSNHSFLHCYAYHRKNINLPLRLPVLQDKTLDLFDALSCWLHDELYRWRLYHIEPFEYGAYSFYERSPQFASLCSRMGLIREIKIFDVAL